MRPELRAVSLARPGRHLWQQMRLQWRREVFARELPSKPKG
jgi:hypothetical protein